MSDQSHTGFVKLEKHTTCCPNDCNVLQFNGQPDPIVTEEGMNEAYCRKCQTYFRMPVKE